MILLKILLGLDVNSTATLITWPYFLDLYCTFEGGQVDKAQLVKFWAKFFDIQMAGFVGEQDYMKLLEQLIRGKTFDKPNKSTLVFAEMYQS